MPWVIGIDEAGYGPNLGPLVQAAVPLKLPDGDGAGWETLRPVARRKAERAPGRLLIDDSKKVYTQGGLEALELGVLAACRFQFPNVGDLVGSVGAEGVLDKLVGEAWFDAEEKVPVEASPEAIEEASRIFERGLPDQCGFGFPAAMVVPAPHFNLICDASGSKGTILSLGVIELIPKTLDHLGEDGEPVVVHCDKHGGRNFYGAMIQEVFPEGWVVAEKETAEESRYRVDLLARPVTVVFRPRADGDCAAVALASMLCKYLREVCMRQFNRYWATHVPGLKPTAGYPVDARRFYAAILPVMEKMGVMPDQVWRKR